MGSAAERLCFNQLIEFVVSPAQQPDLMAALTEQLERYTCTYPGFISASVQASSDGSRVIEQVLWLTREASEDALLSAESGVQDFTAMLRQHCVSAVTFNTYQVCRTIKPRN